MAGFKNYYRLLTVDPTADGATIKAAFRRLALRYHPDRARTARAAQRFREIREAYDVLSDPHKRRKYDRVYRAQTALQPVTGGLGRPAGRARPRSVSGGLGLTLDLLGLKVGLGIGAAAARPAARNPSRRARRKKR